MASFLCEMADVIICVKYAPNNTGNRIPTRVEILQICAHGLWAVTVHVPLLPLDQICLSQMFSSWLSYFQSEKKNVIESFYVELVQSFLTQASDVVNVNRIPCKSTILWNIYSILQDLAKMV